MPRTGFEDGGAGKFAGPKPRCYEDPVRETSNKHSPDDGPEDRRISWPGASTVGVNGLGGVYASWGGFVSRGTRDSRCIGPTTGFQIDGSRIRRCFRLRGADLGYEVDGVDTLP